MLCQCCWTQNRWERINGDSISDIEDLVMTEDGTIYFMLEGKNYYFRSKNYGDSWDLFHPHQTPYFGLVDIRKTYPFDNDNLIVYLEKCYCYMNLDSNNSFNLYPIQAILHCLIPGFYLIKKGTYMHTLQMVCIELIHLLIRIKLKM